MNWQEHIDRNSPYGQYKGPSERYSLTGLLGMYSRAEGKPELREAIAKEPKLATLLEIEESARKGDFINLTREALAEKLAGFDKDDIGIVLARLENIQPEIKVHEVRNGIEGLSMEKAQLLNRLAQIDSQLEKLADTARGLQAEERENGKLPKTVGKEEVSGILRELQSEAPEPNKGMQIGG